jgi:tRNA(His) 5'-end guanylyltransferase
MRSEYRFDYSKSRPNRFASRMKEAAVAIVLDPDVAAVFQSSEEVNNLLRSVITALPTRHEKKKRVV